MLVELLFPVLGGATFALGLGYWTRVRLRDERRWECRRQAQLIELAAPAATGCLVLWHILEDLQAGGLAWIAHGLAGLPLWPLLGFAALTIPGVCVYILRHLRLADQLRACSRTDAQVSEAQVLLDTLSAEAGMDAPLLRRLLTQKPVVLVMGFRRPVVYLSSWYFEQLSVEQLRPVLAHELAHVARQDNLLAAIAAGLSTAASRIRLGRRAYKGFVRERELAADEMAASLTGQPLRLANILLKVLEEHVPSGDACPCATTGEDFEERLEHLIGLHGEVPGPRPTVPGWRLAVTWLAFACVALLCADLIPHCLDLLQQTP